MKEFWGELFFTIRALAIIALIAFVFYGLYHLVIMAGTQK